MRGGGRRFLEQTPADMSNNSESEAPREEIGTSDSGERREKKRFAFLTRSLAEVYVEQNHLASGLEIYRRMLAQNHTNQELERRIKELEDNLAAKRWIKSKEQNS
jgi:hypothetical protein